MSLSRKQELALIAQIHEDWVEKNQDSGWNPKDANPGSKRTDYSLHSLDRSASAEIEFEFSSSVEKALTQK